MCKEVQRGSFGVVNTLEGGLVGDVDVGGHDGEGGVLQEGHEAPHFVVELVVAGRLNEME